MANPGALTETHDNNDDFGLPSTCRSVGFQDADPGEC